MKNILLELCSSEIAESESNCAVVWKAASKMGKWTLKLKLSPEILRLLKRSLNLWLKKVLHRGRVSNSKGRIKAYFTIPRVTLPYKFLKNTITAQGRTSKPIDPGNSNPTGA